MTKNEFLLKSGCHRHTVELGEGELLIIKKSDGQEVLLSLDAREPGGSTAHLIHISFPNSESTSIDFEHGGTIIIRPIGTRKRHSILSQ